MLKSARRHIVEDKGVTNVSFREADAEDLPFERERFDLVTCRIAPHHFPDARLFLRECARVLKPGGILLLQDQLLPDDEKSAQFVDAFERLRDPSHNRAFSEGEWTAMCAAAGIAVEHCETYIKRHQFLPWARRQGNDEATIAQLIQMLRAGAAGSREPGWIRASGGGRRRPLSIGISSFADAPPSGSKLCLSCSWRAGSFTPSRAVLQPT